MTPEQRIMAIGAFINGALFLVFCFSFGIWLGKPGSCAFVLLSSGAAFLCYASQAMGLTRGFSVTFMVASLIFAALAVFGLLI